jgi:hypothetical protein
LRGILTTGSEKSLRASSSGKHFNDGIIFHSIRVIVKGRNENTVFLLTGFPSYLPLNLFEKSNAYLQG